MVNLKKFGITVTTAALSFGLLASGASAQTISGGQPQQLQIKVAATENLVTKEELIKKLKEIFPGKFDFVSNNDFYMGSGHIYPGDDTIRYDLSFYKTVQGKDVHGSFTFVGEDLEIENFYYQPVNQADALFPAKISEEQAKKIAQEFINDFPNGDQYKLNENSNDYYYYYANQVLTEPIRYNFSFTKTNEGVNISDQQIHVTVLGNGELTEFYRNINNNQKSSFDDSKQIKEQADVLNSMKENLNVQLQYQINYDYRTDERHVDLVYNPTSQFIGVHAISGDWYSSNGLSSSLPSEKKVEMLSDTPLDPKNKNITLEEAKKMANKLLAIDSDDIKLTIHSVDENTNYYGTPIISVNYSYEYKNGGYGTNLEIDKTTGEIISYHDIKSEVLYELDRDREKGSLTSSEALTKAIEYLKDWAPSYLHQYAKPLNEPYYEKERGIYNFSFPRVVNGIPVTGDEIGVSINSDGSLYSFYVNNQKIENWPSTDEILSSDEAKERFKEDMELELQYVKVDEEKNHYSLVYLPQFSEPGQTSLDATTGEWINLFGKKETTTVSHPTAEKELNYLIQNNVLEIDDVNEFNAEEAMSKGEALKVLVRSLSYFYEGNYPDEMEQPQSFRNIGPDNPYYRVVERAVELGILDLTNPTFNTEEKLTREELAVWYVRVLGLEQAAKHQNLYNLDVKDADQVTYKGYVALATALNLLPSENGTFNPKREVSYAEMAVSTVRLAHKVYEDGVRIY